MVWTDLEVSAWGYECEVVGDREQAGLSLARLKSQRALGRGYVNGRATVVIEQHVVLEFQVYLHALNCGSARLS